MRKDKSQRKKWKIRIKVGLIAMLLFFFLCIPYFQWGPCAPFTVSLASRGNIPLDSERTLMIFEEDWYLTWISPDPTGQKYGGGKKILGIAESSGPVEYPSVSMGGFLYGPGIFGDLFLYVIAYGHDFSRIGRDNSHNPNAVFHKNPAPKTYDDFYSGATYYLEPLSSREDELKNIENIEKTFGLFGRTTEIEIKDEDKKKIESFVRKMKEELEEETRADGY